ncbi:hypothetical protein K443DRAFT_641 [Laccaria amethystina LaAM-08-1]|uniref:Uncharacterized protein n=1 Tax=Laccaria amethystina LaAM-08-1 TaxID=1095629 RepID=A0A0C9YGM2_9AGAR|nr:hypothetical protein K443DRAFT_641 [Laccaria amethystina LaAM-08-1]
MAYKYSKYEKLQSTSGMGKAQCAWWGKFNVAIMVAIANFQFFNKPNKLCLLYQLSPWHLLPASSDVIPP